MTDRRTTTEVTHSAAQMFNLVADIERYPEFLPWCVALRTIKREGDVEKGALTAEMVVAYKVFRERFKSRVLLNRLAGEIDVDYMDGPFRSLQNRWRFQDLPDGGSLIGFEISFEFSNFILQAAARNVFDKAFARMSEAFVTRADVIYAATDKS